MSAEGYINVGQNQRLDVHRQARHIVLKKYIEREMINNTLRFSDVYAASKQRNGLDPLS
jgi:hypothetical protein